MEFVLWLAEMDRVTRFSGTINRPNPRWQPRTEQVQAIVEQTKADRVKLVAEVGKGGQSLDVADSILGGIVEHSARGYGDYSARGFHGGSEFNYHHGSSEVIEEVVERPSDTARDIFQKLIDVVRRKIEELV